MNQSEDFSFILEAKKRYPQLCHASNIIKKNSGVLNAKQESALSLLIAAYAGYLRNVLAITSYGQEAIFKK